MVWWWFFLLPWQVSGQPLIVLPPSLEVQAGAPVSPVEGPPDGTLEGGEGAAPEAGPPAPEEVGSQDLEAMALAQEAILGEKDFRPPEAEEFSPLEGLKLPEHLPGMREDDLLFEIGTGWLRSESERPGGLALLLSRGKEARGFDIPVVVNEAVEKFTTLLRGPTKPIFMRWLARTSRYYPIMRQILKKYGLPEDLVAVALVESGLYYSALSRAMASGPWQFIKSTGAAYGLKSDFWIDERRDIVKATDAAARHLKDLFARYGDWYLAWAAYNTGAAVVDYAVEKVGSNDFWDLAASKYLRNETKLYVPKILAAALIQKDPEQYGFADIPYLPPLQWDEVEVFGMADLRAAAKAVGTAPEAIQELNPELRYWCSPPYLKSYILRIPKGTKERFQKNYHPAFKDNRTTFTQHRLLPGETLGHLAIAYHTSVDAIMSANRIANPRRVMAGKLLLVPVQPCGTPVKESPKSESVPKQAGKKPEAPDAYTIRSGDTLSEIALKFGTTIDELCEANDLKPDAVLKQGSVLKLRRAKQSR